MSQECIFSNDNNVLISLIDNPKSSIFRTRDNHEALFRKINTYLINNNIIKNNIIDLGSWIGDNSIPWAKNINGIVYAIDPSNFNLEFIRQTCNKNNISNIITLKCAISNKVEVVSTNDHIDHCSFVYNNPSSQGVNKFITYTLDSLYEQKLIENIGYIHLDVEGMEYKVLQGGENIINKYRPIVSFEQHLELDDYNVILKYFIDKKYKVFLVDEILLGCRLDCRNSFAFPEEIYNIDLINDINAYVGRNIMINKNNV